GARARRAGSGTGVGGPGSLWTLGADHKLKRLRVRVGLSDGQRTQVTGTGVAPGMQVIVGETAPAGAAAPSASSNPLTPQRGGGGPGGGGGGRPGGF
ncbi:MAG: efflux transporter periplasmic adaptor subunit, partial [Gemmatimonadetes bacterium]|nr:efflux transporter periplasmic adaptor subunit [Gemmatimonadota bacterium]